MFRTKNIAWRPLILRPILLLLAMSQAVIPSSRQQSNDAVLVEQFFPPSLVSESEARFSRGGPPPTRYTDFVAADLDVTGQADFLVAAYTNSFSAVVRVLRKQNNSATLVAEPTLPLMGGIVPRVSLVNLDVDARPEIAVHFSSASGGSASWIFKWTGSALSVFSPFKIEDDGNITTMLYGASFEDLTGDGIPEILNPPERTFFENPTTVYQLVNGAYALTSLRLYYMQPFVRTTSTPITETKAFSVTDPTQPHVLIICNGDEEGEKRASSVEITLNGTAVAGASQFNQQVRALQIPVTVTDTNTLSVRFAGAPESEILIVIGIQ
jgi:hypothetical protein